MLSLDKLEFLHLISYGNSNIDGSSIDEEDKRFNDIISKYIGRCCVILNCCYFVIRPAVSLFVRLPIATVFFLDYLLNIILRIRTTVFILIFTDDQDILDSVTYFRGGPDSQAVVGDKYVYKHDLQAAPKDARATAPKNVVVVGPTTHSKDHKQ